MTKTLAVEVPVRIETDRLILRPYRKMDAVNLHEALIESIVELREFLWFLPWVAEDQTLDSARCRCEKAETDFKRRTDLPFLAFEKNHDRLIGSVGLHRTDWQVPKTELGYWIRTSEVGNGYATEGVRALVDWSFSELNAVRLELITDEANMGSRNVAQRCGFKLEGVMRNFDRDPGGKLRHNCVYASLSSSTVN